MMEWLSTAWNSIGFTKSSAASYAERRRTEFDVVKHQFLVAVHMSLSDAVVRADPEFAGVLRWILAWEQSRYEYSETEYARLLRMIDNFNGELEHFLNDRGGAAKLVAREIAGYYSLEDGADVVAAGHDPRRVLEAINARLNDEYGRSTALVVSSDPLKNEKQFSQTRADVVRRCIQHVSCLVDAVAQAEADGLLDRTRLFPPNGAISTPSHAQVRHEAVEFVRLRDARDERLMRVLEVEMEGVAWPTMFDELAAWRRARAKLEEKERGTEVKERDSDEKEKGTPADPADGRQDAEVKKPKEIA
ncbi:hypothetical protein Q8F55_003412 [Vanrija albida]|uniref:Uncharacterized protein n=1 Tax=Vanrija albida TaxID=181172 RepID=A0ABR3Q3X9_9TREE